MNFFLVVLHDIVFWMEFALLDFWACPFFCLLDFILEFLGHASSGLFLGFWAYRNCIGLRPGVLSELSVLDLAQNRNFLKPFASLPAKELKAGMWVPLGANSNLLEQLRFKEPNASPTAPPPKGQGSRNGPTPIRNRLLAYGTQAKIPAQFVFGFWVSPTAPELPRPNVSHSSAI